MDFFRYPLDPQKVKESRCLICDPVRVVLPESFNDKFTLPLPSSEREGTVNGVDFDFQGRQYTNTLGSEIGICLEGSGLFYAQGRFFRYNPGDAVYSFADLGRSWQSDAGVRSTWYFMPINLLELMKEGGFNFFRNALNSRFPLPSFPFLLTKAENYAGNHLIWRIFEECLQKKGGLRGSGVLFGGHADHGGGPPQPCDPGAPGNGRGGTAPRRHLYDPAPAGAHRRAGHLQGL